MSNKKDWLIASIVFAVIILFGYFYASTGTEFTLKYDQATQIEGYEAQAAKVVVYPGRSLGWDTVPEFWKLAGGIFLILQIPGAWFVGTERHSKKWMAPVFGFGPVFLAFVCWFAAYSSRLDLGAYVGNYEDFVHEFKVSDDQANEIKEKGGTGAFLFKDESGLLTEYFKNK